MVVTSASAFHHVDVFDPDRAAITEVDDRLPNPIAASAAATVSTNIAKAWPIRLLPNTEKATRLMLTASSISSIDIKIIFTFFRFKKIPKIPSVNRIAPTVR